jgi:hypothetical protein
MPDSFLHFRFMQLIEQLLKGAKFFFRTSSYKVLYAVRPNMQIPINLLALSLSGYYSVTTETIPFKEAVPFGNKIKHYTVILELPGHKVKLISLYRDLSGKWITNIAELEVELRNELRRHIELYETIK